MSPVRVFAHRLLRLAATHAASFCLEYNLNLRGQSFQVQLVRLVSNFYLKPLTTLVVYVIICGRCSLIIGLNLRWRVVGPYAISPWCFRRMPDALIAALCHGESRKGQLVAGSRRESWPVRIAWSIIRHTITRPRLPIRDCPTVRAVSPPHVFIGEP